MAAPCTPLKRPTDDSGNAATQSIDILIAEVPAAALAVGPIDGVLLLNVCIFVRNSAAEATLKRGTKPLHEEAEPSPEASEKWWGSPAIGRP